MELKIHVLAGVVAASLALTATPARAQSDEAKALFEKGAKHYQAEEYEQAAVAFEKLYALQPTVEVLFAWAQAERFSDHCEKAMGLFEKLLDESLTDRNKAAVEESMTKCKERIAQQAPPPETTTPPKADPPQPETIPPTAAPVAPPAVGSDESKPAWYKNPVGGALTATGVVTLGLGVGFYISGRSANSDAESTESAAEFARLKDRAQSRGRIGYIGLAAGTALLATGIVWYAIDPLASDERAVSAWLAPGAGGVAFGGNF